MSDESVKAEPQAEPEAPTPSWLQEDAPPVEYEQPSRFVPGHEPRYMQQSQPQPPANAEDLVAHFARDPEGFLKEHDRKVLGPIIRELEAVKGKVNSTASARTKDAVSAATASIHEHYRHKFSKDSSFMNNPRVREEAERVMKTYYKNAIEKARAGDTGDLNAINDPRFAEFVLHGAKLNAGYPANGYTSPAPVQYTEGGASGSNPPKSSAHSFDIDTVERLKGMGISEDDLSKAEDTYKKMWSRK